MTDVKDSIKDSINDHVRSVFQELETRFNNLETMVNQYTDILQSISTLSSQVYQRREQKNQMVNGLASETTISG